MSVGLWLVIGLFLPLFPLSMVFNALIARADHPLPRAIALIVWPQVGLLAIHTSEVELPHWLGIWALATSGLYAFRLLAMREMGRWIGFLATSVWAVLWLPVLATDIPLIQATSMAAGFSIPLVILVMLAGRLKQRFGAAYIGVYEGLAKRFPRFSGVLVVSLLAATATPLFPGFFAMLQIFVIARPVQAVVLAAIWLIWSWASARLLQGIVVGLGAHDPREDFSLTATWAYGIGLVGLVIAGLMFAGNRL
jgi:hypothetical protein